MLDSKPVMQVQVLLESLVLPASPGDLARRAAQASTIELSFKLWLVHMENCQSHVAMLACLYNHTSSLMELPLSLTSGDARWRQPEHFSKVPHKSLQETLALLEGPAQPEAQAQLGLQVRGT